MAWETLRNLIEEQAEIEAVERSGVPTSCASCYTPLREGPDGGLFCPWDGVRWPVDASLWGEFPGSY